MQVNRIERNFAGGSDDKESNCNAGDRGFDPCVEKIL